MSLPRSDARLRGLGRGPAQPSAEAAEVARRGERPRYALLDSGGDSACCGGSGWAWEGCRCAWPPADAPPVSGPPTWPDWPPIHWHLVECRSPFCEAVDRPWRRIRRLRAEPHGMVPILPGHPEYEKRKAAS